jgi:Pyridine nucleotide-disulphide oxidoreductase
LQPRVSDVVILGAGPYGLSVAAHLGPANVAYRIFGHPMHSWQHLMPKGMSLKSEGFASSLYAPDGSFRLVDYCREVGQPYADVGLPVPLETFIAYGLAFQKRLVPNLEIENIKSIKRAPEGFELTSEGGETLRARRVVVAAGITHFGYLPPVLAQLPDEFATHSSRHSDLSGFRGRKVAVVGAGASAVDVAALLHEAGAHVELVARAKAIAFHDAPREPRPLLQRLMYPRSTIGIGWRSLLCVDAPGLFHQMPEGFRHRVVRRHLGPAPGWFVKEKVVGLFPLHLGVTVKEAQVRDGQVRLSLVGDGASREIVVDHVIAGTGYRVSLERLKFLDGDLRREIRAAEDTPVLNRFFESSVRGLYFVGVASANSFGPLTRFACGAEFAAGRVSKHLAASKTQ